MSRPENGRSAPAEQNAGQADPGRAAAAGQTPEPARPAPDVDPLLLGPPLFVQQNRPLDAPRFTPSARTPESAGDTPNPPTAANGTAAHQPGATIIPPPTALEPHPSPTQPPAAQQTGAQQPVAQQPAAWPAQPGVQHPGSAQDEGAGTPSGRSGGLSTPAQQNQTDHPDPARPTGEPARSGVEDQFTRPAQPVNSPQRPLAAEPGIPAPLTRPSDNDHTPPGTPANGPAAPITGRQGAPAAGLDHFIGPNQPPGPTPAQPADPVAGSTQWGGPQAGQVRPGDRFTGQPAHPGTQPRQSNRPPLEPPQMGQLNRPIEPAAQSPAAQPPAAAQGPASGNGPSPQPQGSGPAQGAGPTPGRQAGFPGFDPARAAGPAPDPATLSRLSHPQPPARTTRPPLEPPQAAQLNRPLAPTETPSGLPTRGAVPQVPAAPAGGSPEDVPSGLPRRPSDPAATDPAGQQPRGHHNG